MTLTIILATLNSESLIHNFLGSLNSINFSYELIVVDGLSSDNTVRIIKNAFPEAKILNRKASGIYDAYNAGIDYAEGQYILFMGADDEIRPEINTIFALIEEGSVNSLLCICQSELIPLGMSTNHFEDKFNLISKNFCHQSVLYRRECFNKLKYDTKYKVMADWVMNLKLMNRYRDNITYHNHLISSYKLGGYSGTTIDKLWTYNHYFLKLKFLNTIDLIRYFLCKKFRR